MNMQQEKVAIVTGGGSGIGKYSALALLEKGYSVTIAGRRETKLNDVLEEVGDDNKMIGVVTDVADPDSVGRLFAKTVERFGRVDLLFNNAGTGAPPIPLEDLSFEQWSSVVNTNLTGAFLCTQYAFREMKKQSPMGGRIINNGSISAHVPRPNSSPYTATKHAITGLTRSSSLDGRRYNIVCSQIDIGNALTEMTSKMKKGVAQADGSVKEEPTMNVQHVADAVVQIANLPLESNVQFMTIMASHMPFIGRG